MSVFVTNKHDDVSVLCHHLCVLLSEYRCISQYAFRSTGRPLTKLWKYIYQVYYFSSDYFWGEKKLPLNSSLSCSTIFLLHTTKSLAAICKYINLFAIAWDYFWGKKDLYIIKLSSPNPFKNILASTSRQFTVSKAMKIYLFGVLLCH